MVSYLGTLIGGRLGELHSDMVSFLGTFIGVKLGSYISVCMYTHWCKASWATLCYGIIFRYTHWYKTR